METTEYGEVIQTLPEMNLEFNTFQLIQVTVWYWSFL